MELKQVKNLIKSIEKGEEIMHKTSRLFIEQHFNTMRGFIIHIMSNKNIVRTSLYHAS